MEKTSPILITGAGGFVGRNLVERLRCEGYTELLCFERENTDEELRAWAARAAFVYHLAGINRPKDPKEFYDGNADLTTRLLGYLEQAGNTAPILVTSSTQAALDNDYGKSKAQAEQAVFDHETRTGAPAYVYRMPGLFGKWCRPNYNSVVATFCYNVAHGLPIQVRDPAYELPLVYIDDVVDAFVAALDGQVAREFSVPGFCFLSPVHTVTLGRLAELVQGFALARGGGAPTLAVPDLAAGSFEKKLYSTYLSYLPQDQFAYPLKMNVDDRGSFTEFLRSPERGQVSVNISKPGIVKGNHWHNSKNEKFLVVRGQAVIRFRQVGTDQVIEYPVSGDKLEVVDIPTGYTHHIENVGQEDLVTVMWANEPFDPAHPDTYFLKV